jgi:hypothetical protein
VLALSHSNCLHCALPSTSLARHAVILPAQSALPRSHSAPPSCSSCLLLHRQPHLWHHHSEPASPCTRHGAGIAKRHCHPRTTCTPLGTAPHQTACLAHHGGTVQRSIPSAPGVGGGGCVLARYYLRTALTSARPSAFPRSLSPLIVPAAPYSAPAAGGGGGRGARRPGMRGASPVSCAPPARPRTAAPACARCPASSAGRT